MSKRIIHYYNEHKDIKPINEIDKIKNLDDLFNLLLDCYSKETAYPSCQKGYDMDNDPTCGHCAITAMIVNDLFGGTIHKVRFGDGGIHYFNKINGIYVDLTSDQFTLYNIDVNYFDNEEVPREYCGKNPDTNKRFNILKERLNAKL